MAPSCRARHFVIVVLIAVGLNYTVFAPRRKRMTRRPLNLLSALSLLVCVAVCVLWIWSHARAYRATIVWPVRQGEVRSLLLYTGRGGVDFSFGHSAMVGERKLTPDGLRFRHHVEEHPVHAGQAKAEALKYRHTACGFGADAYATVMPFYEWHGRLLRKLRPTDRNLNCVESPRVGPVLGRRTRPRRAPAPPTRAFRARPPRAVPRRARPLPLMRVRPPRHAGAVPGVRRPGEGTGMKRRLLPAYLPFVLTALAPVTRLA